MTKIDNAHTIANIIVQDNILIQSCYQMSINEKRLLLLGISKLNPMDMPAIVAGGNVEISVSIEEWQSVFPDDNPYRTLRAAADRLLGRHWRSDDERIKGRYMKVNWFDMCVYDRDRGTVRLVFCRFTSIYLQGMLDEFTKFNIEDIGRLVSFNQIRLYEMLSQFRSTGFMCITLEELKKRLGLEDAYPRWVDFNRSVISVSITAINKNTDLNVSYKVTKTGRKVTGLKFYLKSCGSID